MPSPSPDGDYLNGVTAISRTDAWAVGLTLPSTCNPELAQTSDHALERQDLELTNPALPQ